MGLQVTFDCADPHAQARFWAVATDFEVEDHHDMITGLIEGGQVPADSDDVVVVDGRRRWRDDAAAASKNPAAPNRLLFQRVPEGKTAKNRVHLDLHPGEGQRDDWCRSCSASVPRTSGTASKARCRGSPSLIPRATSSASRRGASHPLTGP